MAGLRTGRSRFGFKMVLLAVLCCALHLKELNGYRALAVPGAGAPNRAELQKMKKAELKEKLRQNRRVLPPLTAAANPEEHVYIALADYGRKIEKLFQGEEFLFIRGGVGIGKSTLGSYLGRQYPTKFVTVPFKGGKEESWIRNIIKAIEYTTQTKLEERSLCIRLEDALQLAVDRDLILVLDEAHTIFSLPDLLSVLFKSEPHPKLLLLSAGEASGAEIVTTPCEIKQKVFWTPPVPGPDSLDDLIKQLQEAGVWLDQRSVEFFLKLCGGHRSIFIAAMTWVREEQLGESWDFRTVVSKVQDSSETRDWSEGTFLGALAESRGVKVNGKYSDLDMVPPKFIQLLCEGPGQIPRDLRRELTIHGFVIPVPESSEGEFRKLDWTRSKTKYAVSNPSLASYYRDELESVRGLKVGVDPSAFQPANCLDLLLRAIPYLTFARVACSLNPLSRDELPFEEQYNAAIIDALRGLQYTVGPSVDPTGGKVDILAKVRGVQLRLEGIMAKRPQKGKDFSHDEHRDRFDNLNKSAYNKADHKGLFIIGNNTELVRNRVRDTRAEGVEIIGLVPNIAHTGYHILYRGAQAAPADLVEYYVECDLVARGLIDGQIRCIQKLLHINPSPNRPGATETQTKAVWVRQLRQDGAGRLELTGNAFKITGEIADIDALKKAIKKEKPCDPDEIDIYIQEDGSWSKQDEEAPLERGASKSDCYGFLLP